MTPAFESCMICADSQGLRFSLSLKPTRHITVMSACSSRSSVCTGSVHSGVSRCAWSTGDHYGFKCTYTYKQMNSKGTATRHKLCSLHLVSLHPSVGFMYFKTPSRSQVHILTHIRAFMLLSRSRSCSVRHTNNCSNDNSLPGARQVRF